MDGYLNLREENNIQQHPVQSIILLCTSIGPMEGGKRRGISGEEHLKRSKPCLKNRKTRSNIDYREHDVREAPHGI